MLSTAVQESHAVTAKSQLGVTAYFIFEDSPYHPVSRLESFDSLSDQNHLTGHITSKNMGIFQRYIRILLHLQQDELGRVLLSNDLLPSTQMD